MLYARIDNGIVVEIIEAIEHSIEDMFHSSFVETLVEATDSTVINGTYDGSVFGAVPTPPESSQEAINQINQEYLSSTDWYSSRKADTGEAIPADIAEARAAAREAIV